MLRKVYFFQAVFLLCLGLGPAAVAGEEGGPTLESLLQLNAVEVFGGEAQVKDGRVTVRFPGKGVFTKGFMTTGGAGGRSRPSGFFGDETAIKDVAIRKILFDGAEGQFTCLGRESGKVVSKFELCDDIKISFRLRVRNLPPAAQFVVTVNEADARSFIRAAFFTELIVVDSGKVRRKATANRSFLGSPSRWFDQKGPGVPFEIVFKENKVSTFLIRKAKEKEERVELVSCEDVEKPAGGRLGFEFRNMTFLMTDLVIEGNLEPAWARRSLAELKKAGTLKVKEPEAVAKKEERESETPASSEPLQGSKRELDSIDIDQPDPEAEDEL